MRGAFFGRRALAVRAASDIEINVRGFDAQHANNRNRDKDDHEIEHPLEPEKITDQAKDDGRGHVPRGIKCLVGSHLPVHAFAADQAERDGG